MTKRFRDKCYLYSPEHRFFHYFFYADYVFQIKQLVIINDLDAINENTCEIIVDQNYLSKFVNFNFKNYEKECNILLFNDGIDYEIHSKNIEKLKNTFKKVNIFSLSNFFISKKSTISLNNYKFQKRRSLKKILGINLQKKIKYFYPIFYSIYNFIANFKYSKNLIFQKKIVFVGKADSESLIKVLEKHFSYNKKIIINFSNIFLHGCKIDCLNQVFDLFYKTEFENLKFHFKYHLVNLIVRTILVNHLKNFECFYHKMNAKIPLDLLHSNIYNKLIMLDLGCKVGNSNVNSRSLLINRFYNKSKIKINFFSDNTDYKKEDFFKNRLILLKNSLNYILNFKEFNCSIEILQNELIKMDKFLR